MASGGLGSRQVGGAQISGTGDADWRGCAIGELRERATYLRVKVSHVLCELIELILALHEVLLQFDKGPVPKPTLHDGREDEFPLLEVLPIGLDRVVVVFGGETFADVLAIDHVLVVEGDDEGAALGRFELDALDGADFDGALGELLQRAHQVGLVGLVVRWHVAEIVQEAVLDHEQTLVGEDT